MEQTVKMKVTMLHQHTNPPYQYVTVYATDLPCFELIRRAESICFAAAEALVRTYAHNPEQTITDRSVRVIRNVEQNRYEFEYTGSEPLDIMSSNMDILGWYQDKPQIKVN